MRYGELKIEVYFSLAQTFWLITVLLAYAIACVSCLSLFRINRVICLPGWKKGSPCESEALSCLHVTEKNMDPYYLRKKAVSVRRELLTMIYHGKAGHTGGALSSVDILAALYYGVMRVNPANPAWEDRDYFIMSKGHCVEGLFCILADLGFFDKEELKTFNAFGTRLIGHPNNKLPGIEMNTGALGHGLSIATGIAKGVKMSGRSNRVFTLMGDGEQAEGSVWEAAMAAAYYKLDNLTAVIDRNSLQISGNTENVMALEPLAEKMELFRLAGGRSGRTRRGSPRRDSR